MNAFVLIGLHCVHHYYRLAYSQLVVTDTQLHWTESTLYAIIRNKADSVVILLQFMIWRDDGDENRINKCDAVL